MPISDLADFGVGGVSGLTPGHGQIWGGTGQGARGARGAKGGQGGAFGVAAIGVAADVAVTGARSLERPRTD